MLVLSRRESERLLFPNLGMSIELNRIQGRRAELAIDAPEDIVIVREEIADLEAVHMANGNRESSRQLAFVTQRIRECLDESSVILNQIHAHSENDPEGQQLAMSLFQRLRQLQREVDNGLAEDRLETSTRALLVNSDQQENALLGSCFRLAGFEVTSTNSAAEAIDFLSLHAAPDFALLGDSDCESLLPMLRDLSRPMRLFCIGEPITGVEAAFPRPLMAEMMIAEISRKLTLSTAA